MNKKIVAVTAFSLISYLNTITSVAATVEVPDSTESAVPTAETDTVGAAGS